MITRQEPPRDPRHHAARALAALFGEVPSPPVPEPRPATRVGRLDVRLRRWSDFNDDDIAEDERDDGDPAPDGRGPGERATLTHYLDVARRLALTDLRAGRRRLGLARLALVHHLERVPDDGPLYARIHAAREAADVPAHHPSTARVGVADVLPDDTDDPASAPFAVPLTRLARALADADTTDTSRPRHVDPGDTGPPDEPLDMLAGALLPNGPNTLPAKACHSGATSRAHAA